MDESTKDLIEKEAIEYAQKIGDKTKDFHDGINAKYAYIDGATVWAEKLKQIETQSHDQVRIIEHLEQELAKERELRKELVSIVEYYHDKQIQYTEMPYKNWNAIIKKAKEL